MASEGSILREMKVMERSIADSVDRLGYVSADKIQQFTDMIFTEVANFTYLLHRAKALKTMPNCPFWIKRKVKDQFGKENEQEVPITFHYGQSLEDSVKNYMEIKVSMGRKSRQEVVVVTKAYAGQVAEEKRGLMGKVRGAFHL